MKTYIDHNDLDQIRLDEMILNSKVLLRYQNEGSHHFEYFTMLLKDIVHLLYKHAIRFTDNTPSVNLEMLQHFYQQNNLQKLRLRTSGSLSNTYLSLKFVLDGLFESIRGRDLLDQLENIIEGYEKDALSQYLSSEEQSLLSELQFKYDELTQEDLLLEILDGFYNKDGTHPIQELLQNALNNIDKDSDHLFEDVLKALVESDSNDDASETSSDLTDGETEDLLETFQDALEEKFSPVLNETYLTHGNHLNDQRFMNDIQGPENKKQFSQKAVSSDDTLVGIQLHEATNATTGMHSLGGYLSEQKLKERHYKTNINNIMKQLKLPRIINKAVQSVDEFNESTKTLGIDEHSMNQMSFDEIIAVHKQYKQPHFIRFINKVGKNKLYAQQIQYKKKKKHALPIDKITTSHKIDLLIEDELIALALDIEAFEKDFYDRYLRDDLLTVDLIELQDKRKGPIILCYDGSGSMEGIKIEETQSHILAILEIAKIQKRHMVIIQFASASEPLYIKEINPKYISAQDVLDILDTFICGGTDFEKPLSKAIEYIKKDQHNKSDILFITDGQCEIRTEFKKDFLRLKQLRDFKLYTMIMHAYTYHDYGDIGDISDEVLEIQEMDLGNLNAKANQRLYSVI